MPASSISPKTAELYRATYSKLTASALADPTTGEHDALAIRVVNLLLAKWGQWAKGTQLIYKAAVLFMFRHHDLAPDTVVDLIANLKCSGGKGKVGVDRKTGFPPPVRQEVITAARKSWSTFGALTAEWIKAATLTGLRPGEWEKATLLGRFEDIDGTIMSPALRVVTAKRRHGDGRKPYRYLGLNHMSDADIETIRIFMDMLTIQSAAGFEQVSRKASRFLGDLMVNIPGAEQVTFYSTRHQFAANAKSLNRIVTVAALMGHVSFIDAPSRYAKEAISEIGVEYPDGIWTVSALPFPDVESLREMEEIKAGREKWFAKPKGAPIAQELS